MTAATTTAKIPDYLQQAMEDALRAGWEVVRRDKSVRIMPDPKPSPRFQPLSFSLSNHPTAIMVRNQLARAGLYDILKKKDAKEGTMASVEPEPEHTMPEEANTDLTCPECGKGGFARSSALGAHRNKAHGVPGTSRESQHDEPSEKTVRLVCSECGRDDFKRASHLGSHRSKSHGLPGVSGAAQRRAFLKQSAVPAARTASPEEGGNRALSNAPIFETVPVAAPAPVATRRRSNETADPEIAQTVHDFVHAITRSAENVLVPLRAKLVEQDKRITELQGFKDAVEAEVSNGNQGPFQTLANIVKHGGEGFGAPNR